MLAMDGNLQLQQLIASGGIGSSEFDETFVRRFVDVYLQKDESGLNALQKLIEEHSHIDQQKIHEFLLSFYLGLLIQILKQSPDTSILQCASVHEFLRLNQHRLFNRHSNNQALLQLSYMLLLEMATLPAAEWPIDFDFQQLIVAPLEAESTPLAFRQTIERLAIGLIGQQQAEQSAENQKLVEDLAEVLLGAEFGIVLESCSRVLCSIKGIGLKLPKELIARLVRKAKRTRKIGHTFAELTARLIKASPDQTIVFDGFQDRFTHSLVLAKLAAQLEFDEGLENAEENNERQKQLLDLLAQISDFNLNLIGPLLPKYQKAYSNQQFTELLLKLAEHGRNARQQNGKALEQFVLALLGAETHPQMGGMVLKVVELLVPVLLTSPSALTLLELIQQNSNFFQHQPKMASQICDQLLQPILIDGQEGFCWEQIDAALRLLNICAGQHTLDPERLFKTLLEIAIHSDVGNNHQFLRLPAVELLLRLYPQALTQQLAPIYCANLEDDQIKFLLLSSAISTLGKQISKGRREPDSQAIECIVELLDAVDADMEESPSVLRKAIQLCEAIATEGFGQDFRRFHEKWAKLKAQLDLIEQRRYRGTESDLRTQMDEMIDAMGQGCAIDYKCGSKDCY